MSEAARARFGPAGMNKEKERAPLPFPFFIGRCPGGSFRGPQAYVITTEGRNLVVQKSKISRCARNDRGARNDSIQPGPLHIIGASRHRT